MTLQEVISSIQGPDEAARKASLAWWDSLAKPLGSLGLLEEMVTRIAALTGSADVRLTRRVLLVLCADNGVIAQGVSQSDASVTAAVADALGSGSSTVSYMARAANCQVTAVDIGMLDSPGDPRVLDRRVRNGTEDITQGPAMTREECIRAIETGIALAGEQKARGTSILLTGEMGIGNTTTSCAVASVLLDEPPRSLAGRGAGLSDAGLERKIRAIERAIELNRPDPADPIDILQKVGGLDLAGLCGVCLGGALYRVPVLLDGLITTVAALCALRLCPKVQNALLPSHLSAEPAARKVLNALGLPGPISAGLRLGEGSGAVAALTLLDLALSVYQSGHTFGHLGIEAYTPQ